MIYFKLAWSNGKTEMIKGRDFSRAFNEAGYGKEALKLLRSHEPVEATDAEVQEFMRLMSQSNGGCMPKWDKISDEGKAQWRERATEHKFKNFNTLPNKFPRIQ